MSTTLFSFAIIFVSLNSEKSGSFCINLINNFKSSNIYFITKEQSNFYFLNYFLIEIHQQDGNSKNKVC